MSAGPVLVRFLVACILGVLVALIAWFFLALLPGNQSGFAGWIGLLVGAVYFLAGLDRDL